MISCLCDSDLSNPCHSHLTIDIKFRIMSEDTNTKQQKTYHKKATGLALNTVKKHSKDHDFKLYGSCFW